MRRMKYGESCLQIPEEILEAAGLNREPDVLIGMAPEVILITSRNRDQTKREKIGEALWGFSEDLEIPLESEGLYLPEEMLMEAGLPCDPDLLDMYLEDVEGLSLNRWRILRRNCWRMPWMTPGKMLFFLGCLRGCGSC